MTIAANDLLSILSALKKGRQYYVDSMCDYRLRKYVIKYHDSPAMMDLLVEQYKADCLAYYFEAMREEITNKELLDLYCRKISLLIDKDLSLSKSELCEKILKNMLVVVDSLIHSGEEMQKKLEKIDYEKEKNRLLFKNEMKKYIDYERKD